MSESCVKCGSHDSLNDSVKDIKRELEKLEDKVDQNYRWYSPVVNKAMEVLKTYPSEKDYLTDRIVKIEKENIAENNKLDAILSRMDRHDAQEELKAKERNADRRANRGAAVTLFLALAGTVLTFSIWLNNLTDEAAVNRAVEQTRLRVIEKVLGVVE
mgnify:FL=1